MQRNLIKQEFVTFGLDVQVVPTPINAQMGLTAMIDSFLVCVPVAAANSVFMGADAGVTITSGLEILAGTTEGFVIDHDGRQLYELQNPLMDLRNAALCKADQAETIPFIAWDMTQIYLVAVGVTRVSIGCFKAVYV